MTDDKIKQWAVAAGFNCGAGIHVLTEEVLLLCLRRFAEFIQAAERPMREVRIGDNLYRVTFLPGNDVEIVFVFVGPAIRARGEKHE